MPRIITGSARGIHLYVPKGEIIRPTSDRAKEALFSKIGHRIIDAVVLDLFAGTGQIALEALSRGAKKAVLVERHREALAAIRHNIEKTRFSEQAVVIPGDVYRVTSRLLNDQERFDLIYCDPPWSFESEHMSSLFPTLAKLSKPGGLIVLESSRKKEPISFDSAGVPCFERCTYGLTVLSFYHSDTESEKKTESER
ncbi:MAG: 16S rRNA (guanine(966)-N(2))-methyltransferase RsmD [Clostridiaceae bacterium]|jgi:16S rRNA (guanine966-N2)-methyltransferase|nr:16S rRNA (guanine(966)-N(2))-methyltransferase RsmD [Clostridiaceae bacterium]